MFQVGDKVRWKKDAKGRTWRVDAIEGKKIRIHSQTTYEVHWQWLDPSEVELVDKHSDIKQAIREVLLSDEFLAAFAKAWQSIIHNEEPKFIVADETRPYKSWDEIASECPPVTVNIDSLTITGSESEAYYLNKPKNGESK